VDPLLALNLVIDVRTELEALVGEQRHKYALKLKANECVERILAEDDQAVAHHSTSNEVHLREESRVAVLGLMHPALIITVPTLSPAY